MADDPDAAALAAAASAPLPDRVRHRLWRARADAFDALRSLCESGAPPPDAGDLLVVGAGDANAACLDKALDAAAAWLEAASEADVTR